MQLRAAREKSGKTQSQVAKEAAVTDRMYQDYEYDKSEPGVRTAIRIARALDSTVEELFGAATPDIEKSRTAIRRNKCITKEYHRVVKNARKSRPAR